MIHEVSTDLENPPKFVKILPLRAKASNPPEYVPVIKGLGMMVDVKAEQRKKYPDLVSFTFTGLDKKKAFFIAKDCVKKMGWSLVDANFEEGRIEAYDTTYWLSFVDDLVIRLQEKNGEEVLDIRSKSRVGFGDFGANAKRVRKYLALLKKTVE